MKTKSYRGVDLSEFNTVTDFQRLSASVDFAILRCGYGGNYRDQDDVKFTEFSTMCEKFNIPYGVYLYSYAKNTAMARDEAEHVLRLIEGKRISCGIWLDLEDEVLPKDKGLLSDIAYAFCDEIKSAGYRAGIYSSLYWLSNRFDERINETEIWLAQWNDTNDYTGDSVIWQYSNQGKINGVSGNVDLNLADDRIFGGIRENEHLQADTNTCRHCCGICRRCSGC